MLLTGYSDLAAIVGSVNDGEVFRFISKPWDNQEIQKTIGEAAAIALDLADTAATPPIVPDRMDAAVLVIDAQRRDLQYGHAAVGGACPVYHAKTSTRRWASSKRTRLRSSSRMSRTGARNHLRPSRCSRANSPRSSSIVLTEASDSELVIELINQAQIFRFINKPVNPELLRQHAQAALTATSRSSRTRISPASTRSPPGAPPESARQYSRG